MALFIDFHRTERGRLEKVKKAQHKCPDIPSYDVKSHQCWVLPEAKKSGNLAKIDALHPVFKIGFSMFPYPGQKCYSQINKLISSQDN